MTLYKNMSVKTAIEIVLMMKVDDDLSAKNMGALPASSFLRPKPLQKEIAISSSKLTSASERYTRVLCGFSDIYKFGNDGFKHFQVFQTLRRSTGQKSSSFLSVTALATDGKRQMVARVVWLRCAK